jgi:hypothetical protein
MPAPFILCSLSQTSYFAFFSSAGRFCSWRSALLLLLFSFLSYFSYCITGDADSVLPCDLDGPPPLVSSFSLSFRRIV